MYAQDPVIIFMHVPKTAGNTVITILEKQYGWDGIQGTYPFEELPESGLSESIKCLVGHNQFGLHRNLEKRFQYFTFFRDPVERVISDYYFTLEFHQLPFESYLYLDDGYKGYCPNEKQTRWATGNDTLDIEFAKHNLEKYFPVIGITEMFAESVFLMKKQFDWEDISYRRENVNPSRVSTKEVSGDIIDLIKERNALDIELYKWAKQRLNKQIRQLDRTSKQQLKYFKKLQINE